MLPMDLVAAAIGVGGLIIGAATLTFLGQQVRLLRRQVVDASTSFVMEQNRTRLQSTLEYIAITMERRHAIMDHVPNETDKPAVAAFIRSLPNSEEARRYLSNARAGAATALPR